MIPDYAEPYQGKLSPWGRFLAMRQRAQELVFALIRKARQSEPRTDADVLTLLAHTTDERIQVDALLDAVAVNEALARELSRAARNP